MSGLHERIFFIVRADGTLSQVLSSRHEAKVHSEISGQPFVEYRFVGREATGMPAKMPEGWAARIKRARASTGLTQRLLASRMSAHTGSNVTQGQVSDWEKGVSGTPRSATFIALAAVLGVSAEWLAHGTESETVKP